MFSKMEEGALQHCEFAHSGEGCMHYHIRRFPESIPTNFKVYLPVHLIPLLFYKRQQLIKNPKATLLYFVSGLIKSVCFVSLMVTFLRAGFCVVKYAQDLKPVPILLSSFVGTLGLLLESNSRACEICLYIVPRFAETLLNLLTSKGINIRLQNGDVLIFGIIISILNYYYQNNPQCIKSTYLNGIYEFWGKN